jgi:serine/threonine-protein kinase
MGDVYLAEDSKLRRRVAIKTIRNDLCENEEILKRIERECLLHARIGAHPHIVTLFDRLEENGQINLVMEYVDGESLQELLNKKAQEGEWLPWREGLTIAEQCLEAIARIHMHGVIHRDIKPDNILITRDDDGVYCAKLMDFGIARMEAEEQQTTMLTKEGTGGPGTPLYMAPEQLDPITFGPISPATDIYSMGVMLYQIISGRLPFIGTLSEIYCGHLSKAPAPVDFHGDPTIPPGIKDILDHALAKNPAQRFPSAKAFREEILHLLSLARQNATLLTPSPLMMGPKYTPTLIPSHDTPIDMMKSGKRFEAGGIQSAPRKIKSILAIALIALLAAAAVGGYILYSRQPAPEPSAMHQVPAAVSTPTAQPASKEVVSPPPIETGPQVTTVPMVQPQQTQVPVTVPSPSTHPEPGGKAPVVSVPEEKNAAMEALIGHRKVAFPAPDSAVEKTPPTKPPVMVEPVVEPPVEPLIAKPVARPPVGPPERKAVVDKQADNKNTWTVIQKKDSKIH